MQDLDRFGDPVTQLIEYHVMLAEVDLPAGFPEGNQTVSYYTLLEG